METMLLKLTAEERDLLIALVNETLSDKYAEVRHSMTAEMHDRLQHEEVVLRGLLEKLQQPVA